MASPTADVVANVPESGAPTPGESPASGEKVDDVHEEVPEVEEPKQLSPSTTLALMQAEMDSVVKSMSDLVKVKEEDQITPYVRESGEVDVAKEQLDVLVNIQHDLKRQQKVQESMLKSQFLLGKMQETMAKLLTERSNDFERQRSAIMKHMQEETTMHQNAMDQVESVVEKVGTTLDQFTSSLTTLASTIKDLSADQRSQGTQHIDVLKGIHYEIQDSKKILDHIRSNTLTTSKETKNAAWQVSELRSGSVDGKGSVSAQKGSLLYVISEDLRTATQSTMEALGKSVKAVNETIEAGVNPEKSLKRKYEEAQEQQELEDQKKEAERLQKEQEERERQQISMVMHPFTGQQMYLTGEQRDQFFRDLAAMKPTDFKVGTTPTNPSIPLTGFPPVPPVPPAGYGYGAMPSMGTPGAAMNPGTPMTPSRPPASVPSFTAPASLPVLPKSAPP